LITLITNASLIALVGQSAGSGDRAAEQGRAGGGSDAEDLSPRGRV
jgi:hypothetical protein